MKVVAVVQARMGSTRLPGKVLKKLGSYSTLFWVVDAARRAPGVDTVVVATSVNKENDAIEDETINLGIQCIRGSEDDVLDRYRQVVEETGADAVVRLTADCPMLDSRVIGETIALFKSNPAHDYASNIDPPTWPDGLDCEVISARSIRTAAKEATRQIDRDTVTRFIARNRSRFPAITLSCPLPGLVKERWVLDSKEDYLFLQALVGHFPGDWEPNYLEILDILDRHPDLRKINQKYARNERFYESLSQEPSYKRSFVRSKAQFQRAIQTIPFGAQTFSKSYLQFPGEAPLFLSHGDGGYAYDVDGNDYVDVISALLPNVLGYRDPDVDYSIRAQLCSGISFSLATEIEAELSEKLVELIPCAEMVKFGKNGADVTAAAIRLSRAHTGRSKIMLLNHCYHGWHDWSMATTERNNGIPANDRALTERSDGGLDRLRNRLSHERFAAVILEPEGRSQEYLRELKEICLATGTVLIFDEVITGFRWSLGGYQKYIGVTPDLATFGKAMANGMPLSAIVGRRDLMKRFAPPDNIFYSGTFFGEALSLAASLATIRKMEAENVIPHLWITGQRLREEVDKLIIKHDLENIVSLYGEGPRVHVRTNGSGGLSKDQVSTLLRKEMIADGVLIISSHNVCYAHGKPEIDRVILAYDRALEKVCQSIMSPTSEAESLPSRVGVR